VGSDELTFTGSNLDFISFTLKMASISRSNIGDVHDGVI